MKHFYAKPMLTLILSATFLLISMACLAQNNKVSISSIQERWDQISYQLPKAQREAAFESLAQQAASLRQAQPRDAVALIWEGIVLSSLAGERGGLGALGLVKQARSNFEAATKLNPNALDGAAFTSLGVLYYQVPGWPVGFGDDKLARTMLKKGLSVDPDGIDANYFYGEFLRDQKEWTTAVAAYQKALAAPARPGREIADAGRRKEATAKLAEVQGRLAK